MMPIVYTMMEVLLLATSTHSLRQMPAPPTGVTMPAAKDLRRFDTDGLFGQPSLTKSSTMHPQQAQIQHAPFARDVQQVKTNNGRPEPPKPPPRLRLLPVKKIKNPISLPLATPQQYEYLPKYASTSTSETKTRAIALSSNAAILAAHFSKLHHNSSLQEAARKQFIASQDSTSNDIARHFTVDPLSIHLPTTTEKTQQQQQQQLKLQQQLQQQKHLRSHLKMQKRYLPPMPYQLHGPLPPPPPPNPFIVKWTKFLNIIMLRVS
jgi:hypothetical protein